jgi:GGDEF domain-containing protein
MELGLEHVKNEPYGIVTLSQGAAVRVPQKHEEFEKFVYEADIKLYQCKEKGRNGIVI